MTISLKTLLILCFSLSIISISFSARSKSKSKIRADISDIIENTVNEKFKNIQAANDAKMANRQPDKRVVDPVLENYKEAVYNKIMSQGGDPAHTAAAKAIAENNGSSAATPTSNLFSSFLSIETKRPMASVDNPDYFFVGQTYTRQISRMPLSGQAPLTPWSSTYWPMKNGGISVRYPMNAKNTIGSVNSSGGYSGYYTWYQSVTKYRQPAEHNYYAIRSGYANYIDYAYSPSEKYDVCIGDYNFSLTNYLKNEGSSYASNGNIPGWYGICHGWAPAAYIFKRPYRAITVNCGKVNVRFLPDDIKALASQFMAFASYTTRWIGARCGYYTGNSGWSYDSKCRSLNPGAFLVSIGNWMGIKGKPFVFDPQADPEIWNQPVKSYSLRYYNVRTNGFYSNYANAMVSAASVRYCGTSWCRKISANMSSNTSRVVGMFIQVTYTVETNPVHSTGTRADSLKTESFDGAIEIDSSGNIMGGEWKYTDYPNFMWTADQTLPIVSVGDENLPAWDGSVSGLQAMTANAKIASKRGQVVKSFVQYLVDKSS